MAENPKKPSKPRSRSKAPKLRTAGAADLADIEPLAKKALEEIGDGNRLAADVATKINEILRKRGEKLFELKSLTAFLQPSKYGKALGVGARKDTYEYAGLSNPQLLSASADCIAFVVDRDAKGVPIMFRDVAAGYLDRNRPNGVPVKSELFPVKDGEDPELTKERARVSALAKLVSRTFKSKPRHPKLLDDIEAADEDLSEKVKAARDALLGRREFDRSGYGTGTHTGERPGLSHLMKRVDGTEYVRFWVRPLKDEGVTYVIRPGHKKEDLDKAWAIARLASGTVGTGQRSLDRTAELKQAAEDLASGKKTVAELCGYFHTDEWKTEGHPLIDREIVTPDKDGPANSEGRVVGWLSAAESDFCDDKGQPAPLFHVQYTAGELEGYEGDLELHEVEAYLKVPDDDAAGAPPPDDDALMDSRKGDDSSEDDSDEEPRPMDEDEAPVEPFEPELEPKEPPALMVSASLVLDDADGAVYRSGADNRRAASLLTAAAGAVRDLKHLGLEVALVDLGGTGPLGAVEERALEVLMARRARHGDFWRRKPLGAIEDDMSVRALVLEALGDAAPKPTRELKKMCDDVGDGMEAFLETRYVPVPTKITFGVPAHVGEVLSAARGTCNHAASIHYEALWNIGGDEAFDYEKLHREVNRLAFRSGFIHALVERRLGLTLPKNSVGDDFVQNWWELAYLIIGPQATAKGLVLRPRPFATAWRNMVKHEEIALYYGAAAFTKAAAGVFHPCSIARANQRGGYAPEA